MKCPRCGFAQNEKRIDCIKCGIVFAKYSKSENADSKKEQAENITKSAQRKNEPVEDDFFLDLSPKAFVHKPAERQKVSGNFNSQFIKAFFYTFQGIYALYFLFLVLATFISSFIFLVGEHIASALIFSQTILVIRSSSTGKKALPIISAHELFDQVLSPFIRGLVSVFICLLPAGIYLTFWSPDPTLEISTALLVPAVFLIIFGVGIIPAAFTLAALSPNFTDMINPVKLYLFIRSMGVYYLKTAAFTVIMISLQMWFLSEFIQKFPGHFFLNRLMTFLAVYYTWTVSARIIGLSVYFAEKEKTGG